MEASVIVVIGFNMVGTKNTRSEKQKNYTQAKLKDSQFGCNSRATAKGHLRMSFFLSTEQALRLLRFLVLAHNPEVGG